MENYLKTITKIIDNHREESMFTCPESCWCWEVETIINEHTCNHYKEDDDMKKYQCNKCGEPCFLTFDTSAQDPIYCPFTQGEEVCWEKIDDEADTYVGPGEIPGKAR